MVKIAAGAALGLLSLAGVFSFQSEGRQGRRGGGQNQGRQRELPIPASAWSEGSVLLGCPTANSVEMTLVLESKAEVKVEFGVSGKALDHSTEKTSVEAGVPSRLKISGLNPNTAYRYRIQVKKPGSQADIVSPERRFQTQRSAGQPFTFIVQGDSHPERVPKMNVPSLYERTLLTAAAQNPDFFICLGDDFSVDTLREWSKDSIEGVYRKQVPYLGLVAHSAPLFLVNGNHEQAAKVNLNGTPDSLGVWAQTSRNRFFAQPALDSFYTGNSEPVEHIGLLRNYFAWSWGDALFVVIDPYWHSDSPVDNQAGKGPKTEGGGKRTRDMWGITLGDKQYQWLSRTLLDSSAKYKFVFAHHVHGTGRGGVELAGLYEWGGRDRSGEDQFAARRPGWALPIHKLFVKAGVSVFFQGHDHIFCRQELDGVIYQTCPCPADPTNSLINGDAYTVGEKVPGAGIVKVTVDPRQAKIDYLRSYEPQAETEGHRHGEVAYSYAITAR